jgi:cytochrome c oxidase subunit 2
MTTIRRLAIALSCTAALVACGANSAADVVLPPAAAEGRDVVRSNGCAACHGRNGGGGVGPTFVGLFGSEVSIQGGETVIADRDYLVESIREPSAKLVEGFNLPMPTNRLDDDQIDAVIAYIEALAEVTP